MRTYAVLAVAVVAASCGFPEYGFDKVDPEPVLHCEPSPCQNDGECVEVTDGFLCQCAEGFRGDTCEENIDDCAEAPCLNGATCLDGVDDYTCECTDGYSGKHCEQNLDDCSPNPCKNGGTCYDGTADYHCECPEGFTGETCAGEVFPTCSAILEADPEATSGVYSVDPDGAGQGRTPIDVYCDMTVDDAGWTLVGREGAGSSGTFRFLAEEEGVASQIAEGSGDGLIGARFAGLYEVVRIRWSGADEGFIGFRPSKELFANEIDTAIPLTEFWSSDIDLLVWVGGYDLAVFCRASQSLDVRPGDTSWAIKPATDTNTVCGCSGYGWAGRGAYYGGSVNATSCDGYGGGWAAVRDEGEMKGGITEFESEIWIR